MKMSDKEFCELYNRVVFAKHSAEEELKKIEAFQKYLKDFYLNAESDEEKTVIFLGEFANLPPNRANKEPVFYKPMTDKMIIK